MAIASSNPNQYYYRFRHFVFCTITKWLSMVKPSKARSQCVIFFRIATAILLIAADGLHSTQWKCSHHVTAPASPTPVYPMINKNKLQSQSEKNEQCE